MNTPDRQKIMAKSKDEVSKCAKLAFENTSKFISQTSGIKQFAIGGASGWCTGFLATRVGKTAAISIGGSIILLGAANEVGLISINWNKLGNKAGEMANKIDNKMPTIKANVGKYSKTTFAIGFVGGFLLGLTS